MCVVYVCVYSVVIYKLATDAGWRRPTCDCEQVQLKAIGFNERSIIVGLLSTYDNMSIN